MNPECVAGVSITDLFDQFIEASTMKNVLATYHLILNYSDLNPCEFDVFFPKLKQAVLTNKSRKNWKAKALFSKIDKKASHRCYSKTKAPTPLGVRPETQNEGLDDVASQLNRHQNNALMHYNCLVIGSGPAGLRTAIELQLLGANRVVVVEKRSRFSRNNVLHLWPFVIDDLKSLGAKKFYGKFCAGSIDHISIRQIQLILLKICLMIGCDFRDSCSYLHLCPSSTKQTNQIAKENCSDSKEATSSCDSKESISVKCPFDDEELNTDIFVKVSDRLNESNQNPTVEESEVNEHLNCGELPKSTDNLETSTEREIQLKVGYKHKDVHQAKRSENLCGARAHFQSEYPLQEKELHSYEWDIIIGADGRRNTLSKFFPRKEFRGRLAIAITANFINRQTPIEAAVPEISGLSFIYNQDMFNSLAYDTNIQLENICYYKDDTHYFVMTAKKTSLLERGVLINDYAATQDLLAVNNIDKQALLKYAKDAAYWTTGLEPLDFALNHYGQEDCAMFDFTSMYAASNACKALRTASGGLTLVGLVGDSLLEPFWPTGSGCARGFLSSFDAAWMCRQWAVNKCAVLDFHNSATSKHGRHSSSNGEVHKTSVPCTYNRMALSVMAERESIYRILAQTTSENLQQHYTHWTLNPHSRYPNLNRHLVVPSQVEHLITDYNPNINSCIGSDTEKSNARIKSPIRGSSKISPKKLKSTNVSPNGLVKNHKIRVPSQYTRRVCDDEVKTTGTYLELEESYENLIGDGRESLRYTGYRPSNSDDIPDDFFIPSISGTFPSSNNLQHLEARKNRDIDECMRIRRQKAKIGVVKDQLLGKLCSKSVDLPSNRSDLPTTVYGNAALFGELKRLREKQSIERGIKPKDVHGPLTLLNSMRRSASFAERVKSFETKFGPSSQESNPSTPKVHIDNIKNLPEFAALQELFFKKSDQTKENCPSKKSKIPIMKLSKDDWNVKCWEKRLTAYKQREFSSSTRSLNKFASIDGFVAHQNEKPEKQIEVFKDRIKEMADKLKKARDSNQKLYSGENSKILSSKQQTQVLKSTSGSQGWVSHLKKELISNVEAKRSQFIKSSMNPAAPNQPIKKLFQDEEENGDSDKHYDHLCINRPINKYLSRNKYSSYLTRTKYNATNSRIIDSQNNVDIKQAYLQNLTSRGSSASSTLSDYSTNTGGSSSNGDKQNTEVKCFRCKKLVDMVDRLTIDETTLHRVCLACSSCGITMRTNEIKYHISSLKNDFCNDKNSFVCAICKPDMRLQMRNPLEVASMVGFGDSRTRKTSESLQNCIKSSRQEFLSKQINYNEIYRNLLNVHADVDRAAGRIGCLESSSRITNSSMDQVKLSNRANLVADHLGEPSKYSTSPSPISITLPLSSDLDDLERLSDDRDYDDVDEEVTIVLHPTVDSTNTSSRRTPSEPKHMIDEEELQRILHLDKTQGRNATEDTATSSNDSSSQSSDKIESEQHVHSSDEDDIVDELSEELSSLNSPASVDDSEAGATSETGEDFYTSEEFGSSIDKAEEITNRS